MKKISLFIFIFISLFLLSSCNKTTTTDFKTTKEDENSSFSRPESYKDEKVGIDAYNDLDRLAFIDLEAFNYGVSSAALNNNNSDGLTGGNWLYIDSKGNRVIAEAKGKGIINKIWTTGTYNEGAIVRIYIDNENTPIYEDTYYNFTKGTVNPFIYPVTKFWNQSGGGRVNYLPIEFNTYMKVSIENPGSYNLFFYVDYELLGKNHEVSSFTKNEDISMLNQMFSNPTIDYKSGTGVTKKTVSNEIPQGTSKEFFNIDGKKQIQSIKITIPNLNLPSTAMNADKNIQLANFRDILNGLKLKIYWDNEINPSVDATFGMFFGMGSFGYNNKIQSLMYGVNDNNVLYNYFPMPFTKNARIVVENNSKEDVSLSIELRSKDIDYNFYNVGYFKTKEMNFYVSRNNPFDVCLLSDYGSGKIVSLQFNGFGQSYDDVRFEEGDFRVYIDNSKTPQVITCGGEDFFNGAGYFIDSSSVQKKGLYTNELSGYTNWYKTSSEQNGTSMYRVFLNDAFTYRDGIRFTVEHGGGERNISSPNWCTNMNVGYETLVCYYHSDTKRMEKTDEVVLSKEEDLEKHNYNSNNETSISINAPYFSSFDLVKESYTGFKGSSEISFTVNIDNKNNGVIISRTFDNTVGNIGASVYVDNKYVGEWYQAGYNNVLPLTESRFFIHGDYTKGKDKMLLELSLILLQNGTLLNMKYILWLIKL